MTKSDARRHLDKIQHFHDHAGAAGHTQALYHYIELGECYKRSQKNQGSESILISSMYMNAGNLMEIMRIRRDEMRDMEPPAK